MDAPRACAVCDAPRAPQLVPERGEGGRVDRFCPACLDAMLAAFPLRPRRFLARALAGRYGRGR